MKKRVMKMIIIVLGVIVVVLAGWYVMFMNFGAGPAFPFMKAQAMDMESVDQMVIADNSLMAEVETEEDAQEIAKLYGIELVSFENGLALYHTEEDPFEVVVRGQENEYPRLSINFKRTGYGYDTNEVQ